MESYDIRFSDEALRDLDNIYEHIVANFGNPLVAFRTISLINRRCRGLALMPMVSAVKYHIRGMKLRSIKAGKYSAVYVVDNKSRTITVFRVIYSRRDIGPILDENAS